MKTSIILPTYCPDEQVHGYLMDFIQSLSDSTNRNDYEFIVVENGSRTPELQKLADRYIHYREPIGYARAVNIGLALATGEYIVIMNNDLRIPRGWLRTMIAQYEGGILAPIDFPYPHVVSNPILEDSHWFSMVMMDRATFTKVGYLDQQLPYRFHDQDYTIRTKKLGLPVRQTTSVQVQHINSATYAKMGRNEDLEERQIMINRYGVAHFHEYVAKNR